MWICLSANISCILYNGWNYQTCSAHTVEKALKALLEINCGQSIFNLIDFNFSKCINSTEFEGVSNIKIMTKIVAAHLSECQRISFYLSSIIWRCEERYRCNYKSKNDDNNEQSYQNSSPVSLIWICRNQLLLIKYINTLSIWNSI